MAKSWTSWSRQPQGSAASFSTRTRSGEVYLELFVQFRDFLAKFRDFEYNSATVVKLSEEVEVRELEHLARERQALGALVAGRRRMDV